MQLIFLAMILIFLIGAFVGIICGLIYFIKERWWEMVAFVVLLLCGIIGTIGFAITTK